MDDKKNIDRLFQEKFKDFEVAPNDAVWEKIKARKDDDRKRVLILPFWYRIAGVAALVAVILSVGTFLWQDTSKKDTIVVTDENLIDDNSRATETENIDTKGSNEGIANQESNTINEVPNNEIVNKEAITDNTVSDSNKEQSPISKDRRNPVLTNLKKSSTNTVDKNSTAITSITNQKQNSGNSNTNDISNNAITKSEQSISTDIANVSRNKNSEIVKQDIRTTPKNNTTETIAEQEVLKNNEKQESNSNKNLSPYFVDPTNTEKNSIEAVVDNNSQSENTKDADSIINADSSTGKKSIFDAIKEKEEKAVVTNDSKSGKRWNISPNVAPVYYDSFGGSSIDPQFSDNTKQGEVNLSYGIQVAYAINKKLIVRSGVSKVDVGYNTEDVGFGIASIARDVNGVGNTQSIVVSDYQGGPSSLAPPPGDINTEILVTSQNPGLLNHSIGYIEVPLELKYALTDSKIGIHMIGGVSTLFLESDEVSIIAGSFRNENVSREQTVNDVSFSGNFGIGFDYKLSDQFKINMEPIFKYQFNGFRDNAENFRPYYFGVYTGISFRF